MRKAAPSFLLAILISILLLVIPAYTGITVRQIPVNRKSSFPAQPETPVRTVRPATLTEVNGPKIYYILAIPVVIAAVPLLLRARKFRVVSAVVLTAWVLIGILSVGFYYLPSAVMMILAAREKSAGSA
jgi:hypothetical protein